MNRNIINSIFSGFFGELKNLNELKRCIYSYKKNKIIYDLNFEELKDFFFFDRYEEFEGVFEVIKYIVDNDYKNLYNYIFSIKKNVNSILNLIFFLIQNVENYNKKKSLYYYLKIFKEKYFLKFKKILYSISNYKNIDKIELFYIFIKLRS